jgi:hypothetical protein
MKNASSLAAHLSAATNKLSGTVQHQYLCSCATDKWELINGLTEGTMPAPVLVVHPEKFACDAMLTTLRSAGHLAAGLIDPLVALAAIEKDSGVRVLVAGVSFGKGKLNGIALARMLRHNARRDIKVAFVGPPPSSRYVDREDGVFLPYPVDPLTLIDTVSSLLTPT